MKVTYEELLPYIHNLIEASIKFNKSERTIRRWMQKHKIYYPKEQYRPGKIDKKKADEIRRLERSSELTQKEIGEIYGISQVMVGKIINNQSHVTNLKIGGEANAKLTKNSANFITNCSANFIGSTKHSNS